MMLFNRSMMAFKTPLLFTIFLFLVTLFSACSKADPNVEIDEGSIIEDTYSSNEIGWTMQIPAGWNILPRNKAVDTQNKGKKAIEEMLGEEIAIEELKNLLHLQKDVFHTFQSTSQPFVSTYDGEWEETNETLKQVLMDTYANEGIRAEVSETKIENIDAVKFVTYEFTLYAPSGNVFLRQILYTSLINGYDFGMNVSYTDAQIRDEILSAWKKSKFIKNTNISQ
jgi:hypothetical protein